MAEKYIINMPLKTTPDDTDLMIIEDAQDTKRMTWANVVKPIKDLVGNLANLTTNDKTSVVGAINEIDNTVANKQQESWKNITMLNGWQNSILPQFRKNNFGALELQGRMVGGTIAIGTVLFTLPQGYYSDRPFYVPATTSSTGVDPYTILLKIAATGEVEISGRVAGLYIYLDNITIPL